jgi:hypothetical protein
LPQFKRRVNVVIQSKEDYLVIEGLRITFTVEKSITPNLDKTNIEIYNLSKKLRDRIDDKDKKVYLNAGYEDPNKLMSHIGQGNITLFRHCFEPPNIVTKLTLADGKDVVDTSVSYTGKENESLYDAIKKIVQKAKADIDFRGASIDEIKNKIMSTGYSIVGRLKDVMDDLAESADADWSVTDDQLRIITRGLYIPGKIILISEESGMIGIPEKADDVNTKTGKQKKKNQGQRSIAPGYIVTTLLNPLFMPGSVVRIKSLKQNIDGEFIIRDVTHRGDTHGHEFFSTLKVLIK